MDLLLPAGNSFDDESLLIGGLLLCASFELGSRRGYHFLAARDSMAAPRSQHKHAMIDLLCHGGSR